MLYDKDYKIATAYDTKFKPKARQRLAYNLFLGAKLKRSHSDDSQQLPIPATFVINKNGIIIWRQFDADYKNRSNVSDILKVLEQQK